MVEVTDGSSKRLEGEWQSVWKPKVVDKAYPELEKSS